MGLAAGYKFTEAFNRDKRKRLKRPSVRRVCRSSTRVHATAAEGEGIDQRFERG